MTSVKLGGKVITNDQSVVLLGVKIDKNLNFTEHITKLCKKGSQKLHALARISKYLSKDKLKILTKSFVTSQFNYCPLTWMFHNRTLNSKINKLHERALRFMYKGINLSFQGLEHHTTGTSRNLQLKCIRSRTNFLL